MHLVIDDQPPVAAVEQLQVLEFGVLVLPPRHDVVGSHGDRLHFFGQAVVFAHLVGRERGLVEDFRDPLPRGGDAGGEHQRRGPHLAHARQADDRLARPARQHDHAAAAADAAGGVKHAGRRPLIVAERERLARGGRLAERDIQPFALAVAGQVLGGKADLHQRLLDPPPARRIDHKRRGRPPLSQERADVLVAGDLFGQRLVGGLQQQAVVAPQQLQAAVAGGEVADLMLDVARHVVLGELAERRRHLLRGQPRRRRVPDGERRDAVGVNVLRRLDQLRKAGQRVAGRLVPRAVDLDEDRVIALNDERIVGAVTRHACFPARMGSGAARRVANSRRINITHPPPPFQTRLFL